MKTGIFYHKETGDPVQIIAGAQTKPTFQEVICYQELTKPYDYFVMEKLQFFADYVREFAELPFAEHRQLEKREELPDKQPRISKGEVQTNPEPREMSAMDKMIAFFDAEDYREKIKIFESMKDELDDHMLNNIAVSLDLPIEDSEDGYKRIMAELKMREKYEGKRGDRL